MAETEVEILILIASIDSSIASAIADPKPSYKIKDVSFDWNGYLNSLRELRKMYVKRLAEIEAPIEEETIPDLP